VVLDVLAKYGEVRGVLRIRISSTLGDFLAMAAVLQALSGSAENTT